MTTQTAGTYIRISVVVDAPIERAFRVFHRGFRALQAARAQPARGRDRRNSIRAAGWRASLRPRR